MQKDRSNLFNFDKEYIGEAVDGKVLSGNALKKELAKYAVRFGRNVRKTNSLEAKIEFNSALSLLANAQAVVDADESSARRLLTIAKKLI